MSKAKRENFGGRMAVIMALAGSAIGLGNIWRFPYLVGEQGGAAFILVYIICGLLLSLPAFFAEAIIGRRTGKNTVGAMETLAPGTRWKWVGLLTVVAPIVLLSYYSVVGGWSVEYFIKAITFSFSPSRVDEVTSMFGEFASSTWTPILCHGIFLALTAGIIFAGVNSGIEKFSKASIPVLFVLIVLITIYSVNLPGAQEGVRYLVRPDFSKLTASTISAALGQSFFSLSLGVGCVLTYASYTKKDENLLVMGAGTAISDTAFAILAGFAIMPAVFAAGIAPSSGPGLIFEVLPFIFAKMGTGAEILSGVVAILFFSAILVAALSSSISLLEVGVAYLVEEKGLSRSKATWGIFLFALVVGAFCSLSFGPLSEFKVFGDSIFNFLDKLVSDYFMTLGALAFTVFVGWKMDKEAVREEFTNAGKKPVSVKLFPIVHFLVKFVAPTLILLIILLGVFKG